MACSSEETAGGDDDGLGHPEGQDHTPANCSHHGSLGAPQRGHNHWHNG